MIGTSLFDSENCQRSDFTSTNSSGTDSKNISVRMFMPPMLMPAITLNCAGMNPPDWRTNGCDFISFISSAEKAELLPAMEPIVLTRLVRIT